MQKQRRRSLQSYCSADQRLCYTPGIYADGYIVFAFPFVRSSVRMFVSSLVRWFVSSVKMSKFWLKFLCWCISHELYIRNHSNLDYRYPIGLALFV